MWCATARRPCLLYLCSLQQHAVRCHLTFVLVASPALFGALQNVDSSSEAKTWTHCSAKDVSHPSNLPLPDPATGVYFIVGQGCLLGATCGRWRPAVMCPSLQ